MLRYPILPETAAKHFIMLSVHALMLRSWLAFGSELSLRELKERPLHYLPPSYIIIIIIIIIIINDYYYFRLQIEEIIQTTINLLVSLKETTLLIKTSA